MDHVFIAVSNEITLIKYFYVYKILIDEMVA